MCYTMMGIPKCLLPIYIAEYKRGTPIINAWAGEAHEAWLATHLGDENSDIKTIARGPCCHCLSLLGHGS